MSDDARPPSSPPKKRPPRPLRPAVRAFLSRPDVVAWVKAHCAAKVPARDAEDAMQRALEEASGADWPDEDIEGVLWKTLRTITDRAIVDHYRAGATEKKLRRPMPEHPTREDEAGERVPDEDRDDDPAHDPEAPDAELEGLLLRRFLAGAVEGNARDEETYRWMLQWTDEDLTLDEVALRAGVPPATVRRRVQEFRARYLPRYQRWRNRTIVVLLLLGAIAIVAVVLLLLSQRSRTEDIQPDPDTTRPRASASASGSAVPAPVEPEDQGPFNQAAPTDAGPTKPLNR